MRTLSNVRQQQLIGSLKDAPLIIGWNWYGRLIDIRIFNKFSKWMNATRQLQHRLKFQCGFSFEEIFHGLRSNHYRLSSFNLTVFGWMNDIPTVSARRMQCFVSCPTVRSGPSRTTKINNNKCIRRTQWTTSTHTNHGSTPHMVSDSCRMSIGQKAKFFSFFLFDGK